MPSSDPAVDRALSRNLPHLYADIAWFGVLAGSAMAFLAVYLTRLGASAVQVGLLSAGPAVVNLLTSLQASRRLEGVSFTKVTFWSSVFHRLLYVVIIPLPWFFREETQVVQLITLVMLAALPGTMLAIAFNATYADLVPPEWRTKVTGRRNALMAVTLTLSTLVSGQIARLAPFPQNFQVIFALGALGAVMSSYHLFRLRSGKQAGTKPKDDQPILGPLRPGGIRYPDAARLSIGLRFLAQGERRSVLHKDLIRGPFGRLMMVFMLFYSVQHISIPVLPVFWVRVLHLTDPEISIGNAIFYATMLFSSMGSDTLRRRLGHRGMILLGTLGYGLYPLLTGLAEDARLFWLASLVGGAIWGMLNVALVNHLFDRVPADDRPASMALHNLVLNLGILAGSFGGPYLAGLIGVRQTLLLAGGLRLASAVLFLFGQQRKGAPGPATLTPPSPI